MTKPKPVPIYITEEESENILIAIARATDPRGLRIHISREDILDRMKRAGIVLVVPEYPKL